MAKSSSSAPTAAPLASVTATEAKNNFGAVLDRVMVEGKVSIAKHGEVRAVLLSLAEYEELLARRDDPLQSLSREFAPLVERMQTPRARAAGRALFAATPARLGRAAVKNAAVKNAAVKNQRARG